MRIVIVTRNLRKNDTIGNDIFLQYFTLKNNGFNTYLFAEHYDKEFLPYIIKEKKLYSLIKVRENIVIYHHNLFWLKGEEILGKNNCKVFIKYHSITPSHFFKNYSTLFEKYANEGVDQIKRFIKTQKVYRFIADSIFDTKELENYGLINNNYDLLSPFNRMHEFENMQLNLKIVNDLIDDRINVLFVGEIIPHKGHRHLIETIKTYMSIYGRKIRLFMIGDLPHQDFIIYYNEMIDLIKQYNLEAHIFFLEKMKFDILYTYYVASHIFLLLSEYEGFCVPILEAQYNKLPIAALDRAAVKEILGKEQIFFKEIDYELFAATINVITNNIDIRRYLVEKGLTNYCNYHNIKLQQKFIKIIFTNER